MKRLALASLLIVMGLVLLRPHHQLAPQARSANESTTGVVLSDDSHPTTLPTQPAPATTTTAPQVEVQASLSNTDALERTTPLVQHLPRSTPHYAIDYAVATDGHLRLTVTLLAVLNSPSQVAAYRADLKAYKGEALDWLRSQGTDPTTLDIRWLPLEAGML